MRGATQAALEPCPLAAAEPRGPWHAPTVRGNGVPAPPSQWRHGAAPREHERQRLHAALSPVQHRLRLLRVARHLGGCVARCCASRSSTRPLWAACGGAGPCSTTRLPPGLRRHARKVSLEVGDRGARSIAFARPGGARRSCGAMSSRAALNRAAAQLNNTYFEGRVRKWELLSVPLIKGDKSGEVRLELLKWVPKGEPCLFGQTRALVGRAQHARGPSARSSCPPCDVCARAQMRCQSSPRDHATRTSSW